MFLFNTNPTVCFALALIFSVLTDAKHFNGGTIRWEPVNPNDTSNLTTITITQTYYWTYPYIKCLSNVSASSGFGTGSDKLICVVDCATSGNYSANPISKLTDCISTDASTGLMISQRSVNVTLPTDAHFYIANVGTAWSSLGYPVKANLEWSIVTNIDLRKRSDGIINTPPVATVVSPQYAIVNRSTEIIIPVSDVNVGDDIRCRWSVYISGYRRRRQAHYEEQKQGANNFIALENADQKVSIIPEAICATTGCNTSCLQNCDCDCSGCQTADCTENKCYNNVCSQVTNSTNTTTADKIAKIVDETAVAADTTTKIIEKAKTTTGKTVTAADTTTTIIENAKTTTGKTVTTADTTTSEIVGTLKSTSTYPVRQAIDECGGICYSNTVPNGTILSNCTISFTPTRVGVWYAFAIQVSSY